MQNQKEGAEEFEPDSFEFKEKKVVAPDILKDYYQSSMTLEHLEALNTMENLKQFMMPVEKAIKYRDSIWVKPEKAQGFISIQELIHKSEKENVSELQIRQILQSLLTLLGKFTGQIKHLDPDAVFVNQDYTEIKVICGDKRTFDFLSIGSDLRFATPEVLSKIQSEQSKKNKIFSDAQIWWDLGIILYELSTGGLETFSHAN